IGRRLDLLGFRRAPAPKHANGTDTTGLVVDVVGGVGGLIDGLQCAVDGYTAAAAVDPGTRCWAPLRFCLFNCDHHGLDLLRGRLILENGRLRSLRKNRLSHSYLRCAADLRTGFGFLAWRTLLISRIS